MIESVVNQLAQGVVFFHIHMAVILLYIVLKAIASKNLTCTLYWPVQPGPA
jgi:hypothetical protein